MTVRVSYRVRVRNRMPMSAIAPAKVQVSRKRWNSMYTSLAAPVLPRPDLYDLRLQKK